MFPCALLLPSLSIVYFFCISCFFSLGGTWSQKWYLFQGSSPQIQRSMAKEISQGSSTWPMTCQNLTCMFNFRHCEGAPQAPLKSAELLREHKVCCMQNALCEWSLRLETLWGRTFLLAVISIRMTSHLDDVFLFSPRCITKEISTRCILQRRQQRGRKSMRH